MQSVPATKDKYFESFQAKNLPCVMPIQLLIPLPPSELYIAGIRHYNNVSILLMRSKSWLVFSLHNQAMSGQFLADKRTGLMGFLLNEANVIDET